MMILRSTLLHVLVLMLSGNNNVTGFCSPRSRISRSRGIAGGSNAVGSCQYTQKSSSAVKVTVNRNRHNTISLSSSSPSIFDNDEKNYDKLSTTTTSTTRSTRRQSSESSTMSSFFDFDNGGGKLSSASAASFLSNNIDDMDGQTAETIVMIGIAVLPSLFAFLLWGNISESVAYLFDKFAGFQGQNVDGNAFAANLLRPTINGVVVPAASIALGTLFATTINVLWERQVKMRSCINKEVGELRLLRRALFGCFGTAQHSKRRATALQLLHDYTNTLVLETKGDCIQRLEDIQRNGGISMSEIDELADMLHGVDGAAASRQGSIGTAESLLVSLNGHRSERVAITLSYFPNIHWVLLIFLYLSIQISFFIDSNQGVLQYLNSLQLRVLFAIIVGVGSGAGMLLKELQDPFSGTLGVTLEAMQLKSLEELLEADVADAENEIKQIGLPGQLIFSSSPGFLDENHPDTNKRTKRRHRPKYNTANTLLFHLFTGPRAGTVRFIGDILAWVFRQVYKILNSITKVRLVWSWGIDQWKFIKQRLWRRGNFRVRGKQVVQ